MTDMTRMRALGTGFGVLLAIATLAACGSRPKTPLGPPPEYEEPTPASGDAGAPAAPPAPVAPSASADGGPR